MPGNPDECRLNATRCSELARTATTSESCQALIALAEAWKRLAAELEADQMLLDVLSELELNSQPYDPLLLALKLHSWAAWPSRNFELKARNGQVKEDLFKKE
jgi:hypothetical protein